MPTNHTRRASQKTKPNRRPAANGWVLDLHGPVGWLTERLGGLSLASVLAAGDRLRHGLEREGARVAAELVEQASRAAGRIARPLGIASGNGVKELRQRLGRVERRVEKFAKERRERQPEAPAAEPDEVPPPLPPWPAD